MSGIRIVAVVVVMALVGVACGAKGGRTHAAPRSSGTRPAPPAGDFGDVEEVDWLEPVEQGVPSSVDHARGVVSFPVEMPDGLGDPTIYVTDPANAVRAERLVAFVYDVAPYGIVDVVEGPPDPNWATFVADTVAASKGPGVSGSAFSVILGDGSLALVTVAEEGVPADISWPAADEKAEITVEGPALTADQAQQLANSVF